MVNYIITYCSVWLTHVFGFPTIAANPNPQSLFAHAKFLGRKLFSPLDNIHTAYTQISIGFVKMVSRGRRRVRSNLKNMDRAAASVSRGHKSETMTWDELENWQKDNEYILRGYRR